jgi:hypothetical protein
VRTLKLGDYDAAERFAPIVERMLPELRSEVAAQRDARSSVAREFVLAFFVLREPLLGPDVTPEIGPSWTSGLCVLPSGGEMKPPPFVTAAQRNAAAVVREQRRAIGQRWLNQKVLAWAEAAPGDPRLPHALHLVVRKSREGATRDGSASTQAAFRLLHRRYPRSAWTAKTPYWYR